VSAALLAAREVDGAIADPVRTRDAIVRQRSATWMPWRRRDIDRTRSDATDSIAQGVREEG
jgi:hypothetical protein